MENLEEEPKCNDKLVFPKNIGIVFIEELVYPRSEKRLSAFGHWLKKRSSRSTRPKVKLNFDQLACAHLLLQINTSQTLAILQVIEPVQVPIKSKQNIIRWFDEYINRMKEKNNNIDYWIGITSEPDSENRFFRTMKFSETKSKKRIWIVTTDVWEKWMSPPSLFEYICISVFICILRSIFSHIDQKIGEHMNETRGCIFDWTGYKPHRRILVSNPNLCSSCKDKVLCLDTTIRKQMKTKLSIYEDINQVLSKKWMGSVTERNSPVYNIKKNYRYDIERNSGFYKKPWEKFRDSIIENTAEWTIGGIIATALSVFGAYLIHGR
jgi:hypothetical protein